MLSFFTILLILVGANALFMVFSLSGLSNRSKKSEENQVETGSPKIRLIKNLKAKIEKAI